MLEKNSTLKQSNKTSHLDSSTSLSRLQNSTADPNRIFLTAKEVSEFLGGTPTVGSLAAFRSTGRHSLKYIKVARRIRYRLSDVLDWLSSQTIGGENV